MALQQSATSVTKKARRASDDTNAAHQQ